MTTIEIETAIRDVVQDETIPVVIRCDMLEELMETINTFLDGLCERRLRPANAQP